MERNKELLLKAADRIEAIPESYNQQEYRIKTAKSPCGTAACLAGEIIICSTPTSEEGLDKLDSIVTEWNTVGEYSDNNPGTIAGQLVGLTTAEIAVLFQTCTSQFWPEPFKSEWIEGMFDSNQTQKAKAAAGLLRYLANEGVVNIPPSWV